MDMLPDFMKICYEALPDTMNEMGYWIEKKHGHNPTKTLRTSVNQQFSMEACFVRRS